jgi:hypothetical protein
MDQSKFNKGRYLLFAGCQYYPSGGWDDFKGSFDTIDEAKEQIKILDIEDWWHIVDLDNLERVHVGNNGLYV